MIGLGIGIGYNSKGSALRSPYDMTPSLMCWYELDGVAASNTELKDFTPSGSPTNPAGLVGNCLNCGGAGNYSRLDPDKDFVPATGTNKTICGWFNLNGVGSDTTILNAVGDGGTDWIMRLYYDSGSNRVKLTVDDETITNTAVISASDWMFFAIRYNGTTNTFRLTVKSLKSVSTLVKAPIASAIPFGVDLGYDTGLSYGQVSIDQLGVWEYEHSDTGLSWLYNYGMGRSYTDILGSGGI